MPKPNILNGFKNYFSKTSKSQDYSDKEVLEDLMAQKEIIKILTSEPRMSFSLLGNLKFIDYDTNGNAVIYTRPLLVKPGANAEAERLIHNWETANMKIQKETKFLGILAL